MLNLPDLKVQTKKDEDRLEYLGDWCWNNVVWDEKSQWRRPHSESEQRAPPWGSLSQDLLPLLGEQEPLHALPFWTSFLSCGRSTFSCPSSEDSNQLGWLTCLLARLNQHLNNTFFLKSKTYPKKLGRRAKGPDVAPKSKHLNIHALSLKTMKNKLALWLSAI